MIAIARPSISPYLSRTLFELQVPVLIGEKTGIPMLPALRILSESEVRKNPKMAYQSLLLTSSENGLSYLYELVPNDERVLKSRLFKDKVAFRRALVRDYPGFYFEELRFEDLEKKNLSKIPFPVVLKPSVGISSIGVIRINSAKEWKSAVEFLKKDILKYRANYKENVIEAGFFIIEKWITGKEIAIDGYYDENSKPVILNVLEHLFAGEGDTSDLIYCTQKSFVKKYFDRLTDFLQNFGDIFDLKRFPFHLEVRINEKGEIVPIELNPLRFAGMGTAELAEYAWGINVYKHFFQGKVPDWKTILDRKDDSVYSFMCADVSAEKFRAKDLKIFDREFFREFEEVLEYRILDELETSTFAVIFYRSSSRKENEKFLKKDLTKFYSCRAK